MASKPAAFRASRIASATRVREKPCPTLADRGPVGDTCVALLGKPAQLLAGGCEIVGVGAVVHRTSFSAQRTSCQAGLAGQTITGMS